MAEGFSIKDNMNDMFENLEKLLKTKTVVGEPMQVGDVTLVPFIEITFGLGTGGGNGSLEDKKNSQGEGGGAGSGGNVPISAV